MNTLPEYFHWLLLHRVSGLGPKRFQQLIDRYGAPAAIFAASDDIAPLARIELPELADVLSQGHNHPLWQQCLRDCEYVQHENIHVVTLHSPSYPALLREIVSAPPVLFVKGDITCLNTVQLAVVGARKASKMAMQVCYDWSLALAARGVTITSGLAIGVDGAAHRGALDANGKTVAVLAQGIDQCYPKRHQSLADAIIERGALVSEFPLFSEPRRDHFPRRNRIVSGLSRGVWVVEAAIKSGSLITARFAAEQNRDVFAMPGSISNPMARGCHHLIKQGAFLVDAVDDFYAQLPPVAHPLESPDSEPAMQLTLDTLGSDLAPELQKLLANIPYEFTHLDCLIEDAGKSAADISSQLLELELAGWVENMAVHYRRIK